MKKPIFFSWSKNSSITIANAFYEFMPLILPVSQNSIFFSPNTISKNATWFTEIQIGLSEAKSGIVFLTKENLNEEWILFEAGGLFSKEHLCILLCDCDISYLKEKGSFFQNLNVTRLNDREDLFKLFDTIRVAVSPDIETKVLRKHFDTYFHELEEKLFRYIQIDNSRSTGDFSEFEGFWRLHYHKDGKEGGEMLKIQSDGKYFLLLSAGPRFYYFQLKLLEKTSKKIVWQKFQVENERKISPYIHSIETLTSTRDNNILRGTDTLGNEILYERDV